MNYVNNPTFQACLVKYKRDCEAAAAAGKQKPQLPRYFAESIMQIADRLGRKPQFCNYSYLPDMQSDGIMAAVRYADSYKCDEYQNPFAYFTRIIWNAFINRINVEHAQQYTKALIVKNTGCVQDDEHFTNDSLNSTIINFESKMAKRKAKEKERQVAKAQALLDLDSLDILDDDAIMCDEESVYEEAHSKNRHHNNWDVFEGR